MIDFAKWQDDQSFVLQAPLATPLAPGLETLLPHHLWIATSGSSRGVGRWVGLSREAVLASARAVNHHLQVQSGDVWINVLPTYHVGGLGIFARAFISQSEVVDMSFTKWSAPEFWRELQTHKATLTSLVPTQVFDLVSAGLTSPPHLRAVVVGGGALSPALYLAARDLAWPLLPSYGLTECASQVATASLASLQKSTLQNFIPELEVLSHVQTKVDSDQVLSLKSPALLTGYAHYAGGKWQLDDPKQDNWFTTEDRADLEGAHLRPYGRKDSQVKILGELVDLEKLNEILSQLLLNYKVEAVLNPCADERRGWRLDLVVKGPLTEAEKLWQAFNEAVAPFERTHGLYLVNEIPKSALGKPLLTQLSTSLGI